VLYRQHGGNAVGVRFHVKRAVAAVRRGPGVSCGRSAPCGRAQRAAGTAVAAAREALELISAGLRDGWHLACRAAAPWFAAAKFCRNAAVSIVVSLA